MEMRAPDPDAQTEILRATRTHIHCFRLAGPRYCGAFCICGIGRAGASPGAFAWGGSAGALAGGGSAGVIDGGVYCIGGAESSESSGLPLSSGLSSSGLWTWF